MGYSYFRKYIRPVEAHTHIMTLELLTAFLLFALVSSITPGPNNLMLMASGANYGVQRTVPHMLGVTLGFVLMLIIVGVGLMQLFERWPMTYTVLKVLSMLYLVYLAWLIANASAPETGETQGKPFTFIQAALFQWVNPKAWAMVLTAVSVYSPTRALADVALIALLFGVMNFPSITLWVMLGRETRRWLSNPLRLRVFNVTMALLLVASLLPVLFGR